MCDFTANIRRSLCRLAMQPFFLKSWSLLANGCSQAYADFLKGASAMQWNTAIISELIQLCIVKLVDVSRLCALACGILEPINKLSANELIRSTRLVRFKPSN